ncbi:stage II sporulation protein P [Bacillus sp. 2205SS5-2]|uniref:stage II sporulation protein P n=1 Tax=Bacillus sp. 2205SS5-2 TaxID=3109031 RepID=UPI003007780B
MKSLKSSHTIVAINITTIAKGIFVFLCSLLSIFVISGFLTTLKPEYRIKSDSVHRAAEHISGESLFSLFTLENHMFQSGNSGDSVWPTTSELLLSMTTNIRFEDPRSYLGRELPGFSIFDGNIVVAGEGTNYTNLPIESLPPMDTFEKEAELQNTEGVSPDNPPPYTGSGEEKVYIYFTHTRESFLPYLKGITDPDSAHHSQINVTKIGDKLETELEGLGIGTITDKSDIVARLNQKGIEYFNAYEESRQVVQASVTEHRDLLYLIDIHRDAQRKGVTTTTIGGQPFAKLAFVVGAEHPNYEENLKVATALHNLLEKHYPGLSRGIIEKKGAGTNGKFNQDLSEKAMLIEFGGVDNTFEELNRSAEAFAKSFAEYYWQAEKVSAPSSE